MLNFRVLIEEDTEAVSAMLDVSTIGSSVDRDASLFRLRGVPITFWATALAGNETVKFYLPKYKNADIEESGDWVDTGVELTASHVTETIFAAAPLKIVKSATVSDCGVNCSV